MGIEKEFEILDNGRRELLQEATTGGDPSAAFEKAFEKSVGYEHEWKKGDLLCINNLAVQHMADESTGRPVKEVGRRLMHRTTNLMGDRWRNSRSSYMSLGPNSAVPWVQVAETQHQEL